MYLATVSMVRGSEQTIGFKMPQAVNAKTMFALKIERLRLNIGNAAGHEHRVHPIALRAVALLAERLDGPAGLGVSKDRWDTVAAEPVDLHLNVMSDEQAAEGIATAWANALTTRTGGKD